MSRLNVSEGTSVKLDAITEIYNKKLVIFSDIYRDNSLYRSPFYYSDVFNRDILPDINTTSADKKKRLSVIFTHLIDEFHRDVVSHIRHPHMILSNLPEVCENIDDGEEIENNAEIVGDSLQRAGLKNMKDCIRIDMNTYLILIMSDVKTMYTIQKKLNGMKVGNQMIKAAICH
jgi:hypothetical protein